jgi:cell division septation protein DedD
MSLRRVAPALALALSVLATAPLSAQSLDRVEELARLGRSDEARALLVEWWEESRDAAPQRDLQRGLWLRGRLTVDPNLAELDYQRLVVLYPSSPFAPQALLRLAQSAHAHGDGAGAERYVSTITRDYPTSPVRTEAESWLRGAGTPPTPAAGSRPTPVAAARDTTPRPAPPPVVAGTTTPVPTTPPPIRPTAPADAVLEWSVQFGAFTDGDRAFALHGELVAAGLAARLVRVEGSGFVHVRIGRFANRAEAATQLQQVTARGFTAAIVRDDRAEEVVRR